MNVAHAIQVLAFQKVAKERESRGGGAALMGGLAGGAAGGLGGSLYAGWAAKKEVTRGMEGLKGMIEPKLKEFEKTKDLAVSKLQELESLKQLVGSKIKSFQGMSLGKKLRYLLKAR